MTIESLEKFVRVNGWLNVRIDVNGNQSLFDFSEYYDGIHHTLSEAQELFNEWQECSHE